LGTNQTEGRLGFVLTAHQSPAKLAQDEGKTSPFFNIFGHMLELGPLTQLEAEDLIAASPQPFPEEDVDWIVEQSRCWLCLLQAMCHTRLEFLLADRSGNNWQEIVLHRIEPFKHLLD
jgi:hypothetical protein